LAITLALTAVTDGGVSGTPGYRSPEQWFAFENIDSLTDIFSLGILFYEMITVRRPSSYSNNMNRRSVDPHSKYRPTISQKLDCCTLKMIDLIPENRYQSVWDLISEIENLPDNY